MSAKVKGWAGLSTLQIDEIFLEVNQVAGLVMQGDIQEFTPVDTGTLRNSVEVVNVNTDGFTIGVPVTGKDELSGQQVSLEYAFWQNYGTSLLNPVYFMQKGLNKFSKSGDYATLLKRRLTSKT